LETINTVFQEFKLVRGTWEVKNPQGKLELVRPQDIRTTALLTVEGELDDISGSGQTEAAHKLCSGIVRQEHHHLEAKGAGHYGIFSGRRWRDMVYPHVKSFILEHNKGEGKSIAKPKAKVAAKKAATKPAAKKATAAKK
jgi:poly(3-hydroxybutyrate) depolymerase